MTERAPPHGLVLSGLWVYPLKGARGVRLLQAEVGDRGLLDDRRWMVVDRAGEFITQRQAPRLALVAASLSGAGLELELPGGRTAHASRGGGAARSVVVWGNAVSAEETSGSASEAMASFLGQDAWVVYQPDSAARRVKPEYGDDQVSFADGFPFLLAGDASLADLSARVGVELPMERFRPNLAFAGGAPWGEDELDAFEIGPVRFRAAKPCDRCSVVTVEPWTAEVGAEPLRTLATFRKRDGRVLFGQNLVHEGSGTLHVGDALVPLWR